MNNFKHGFEFLHEIATADVAFRASGKDLPSLFDNCSQAVLATYLDPATLSSQNPLTYNIDLENPSLEGLLFDFLNELIYLMDVKQFITKKSQLTIHQETKPLKLNGRLYGESLNRQEQTWRVDIKAVTKHKFMVTKENDHWSAQVVLDI